MRLGLLSLLFVVFFATQAITQDEDGEKHQFQAEVTRMMKLIINSLYTNKDIFLRELISNASDALDKIRVLALTNKDALDSLGELEIRIKADEDANVLHITDTGIGMTRQELINNLGTIAHSGTSEFLKKNLESPDQVQLNDLIGQFGVGFYSSFLVADKVVVSSKANGDPERHLWISNSTEYSIKKDDNDSPDALKRGTTVTLYLKDEAKDFVKQDTLEKLITKYSQFINFPIYLWTSKRVDEEVPVEEEVSEKSGEDEKPNEEKKDDSTVDEEEKSQAEKKPKTKKVSKTVWEWKRINVAKPIWQRKSSEVSEEEYNEFYKSITRDHSNPFTKTHFTAEGELTFKSLLFIPKQQPAESFSKYGSKSDNIKLYVRRVFISDQFNDLMPSYLSFVRGVVDSDDLPLNVGRETLQQHKLLKVIKKKLVRKTIDMIKKIDDAKYDEFWKEYSTNMKLGIIEDQHNRNRLAKLLRFHTSKTGPAKSKSLTDYVKEMPEGQDQIYFIAGSDYSTLSQSPFVEGVLKLGYEVLYLVDAVDEYCLSNLLEFEGKKFQNVAKEGLTLGKDQSKVEQRKKTLEEKFKPLINWMKDRALKDKVLNVQLSERLSESPAALVASNFGWTGNMERLAVSNAHAKAKDMTRDFYLNQKKIFEINPYHPVIKELLGRVSSDEADPKAEQTANLLFETATIRSGYMLRETEDFGKRIEKLMRVNLNVPEDAPIEDPPVEETTESVPVSDTNEKDEL